MKRTLLVVAAALAGITLFLLTSASANTPLFERRYPLLLAANGFMAVILAGLVGIQVRGLVRELRARKFGARLKARLLAMFALMALLPGLVMYAVSLQFVVRSIESWFDVRVDTALEGGVALGRSALESLGQQILLQARDMALELSDSDRPTPGQINRLRELAGVEDVLLLSASGQVLATAGSAVSTFLPKVPSAAELRQARLGHILVFDTESDSDHLSIRVVVPLDERTQTAGLGGAPGYLQLIQPVPESLMSNAEAVEAAYREYQQLSLSREGLQRIYTITLSLALLLALLAAVGFAFLLARRLTAPLKILAEGTQAVAQGDFSPRQALPERDELGVLTHSFNRMTRQLDEARAAAERNRNETEAARTYLESVLANLSAGVLAFSADGHLRAANRGALEILGDDLDGFEDLAIEQWPRLHDFREVIQAGFSAHEGDWDQQGELITADGNTRTLLLHGTRLPDDTGWVLVFDDISELLAAQRTAAWAEVARRLAHEIKNPLTPIQLSAERLAFKLADRLDPPGREMLERATTTIVNQVEAMKNLVNAFRDYARLPAPELKAVNLNALIGEVLALYESSPVHILPLYAEDLPTIAGDAPQLRQLIHNLMQNAEDALAETSDPQLEILTCAEGERISLILRDNGPGFDQAILARAFEPYFTTKSRGTGLGLAIVKKIIDEHGGEIRLANRETGGAEVRIRLRRAEA